VVTTEGVCFCFQRLGQPFEHQPDCPHNSKARPQIGPTLARYFTALDTARKVQRQAGNMFLDGHLQELQEAEAELRTFLPQGG
jgi:hypothetical protein